MSIKTNKLTLNEKIKCLSLQFVVCPQPFGSPRHETKERRNSPALHPSPLPLWRPLRGLLTRQRRCFWGYVIDKIASDHKAPRELCARLYRRASRRCRLSVRLLRLGSSYVYEFWRRCVNITSEGSRSLFIYNNWWQSKHNFEISTSSFCSLLYLWKIKVIRLYKLENQEMCKICYPRTCRIY